MAIVDMKKLTLIGLEKDKDTVLRTLMKLGTVELADSLSENEEAALLGLLEHDQGYSAVSELEEEITRVKFAIEYIGRLDKKKKKLFALKKAFDEAQFSSIISDMPAIFETADRIADYDTELALLKAEENRLCSHIGSLMPWRGLDIPLDMTRTASTIIATGTAPSEADTDGIKAALHEEAPESCLLVLNSDVNQHYLLIIYFETEGEKVYSALKQFGFSRVSFKDLSGTVEENLRLSEKRIGEIEDRREEIEKSISELAGERERLEALHDHLVIKRDRAAALSRIARTECTFVISGWTPAEECGRLQKAILQKADCIIEFFEPGEEEEHPILLRNNAFVQPFEVITEMYSLPSSRGIDPNLFMAPFFLLFFGMMLSDAGYGLILSLATGFVLLRFKPKGMVYKLVKLAFLGGISTLAWGALFGGWFGNLADVLSGKEGTIPPLWFNPLEDPMKLLLWSFILGGIHIFTGLALKGYMLIRNGKLLEAVYDVGFWFLLLLGLVMLAGKGPVFEAGKYMAIAGAVLLVLTQGRAKKNIIARLFSGITSLYGITGYFSDLLSYSRLLALGLATGVIATVINTMGSLFGPSPFGVIVFIVVFLIGTVFNISINVLGAYVHSSRLQYVEFFAKFYESGGKGFEPLKIRTKYINLIDGRQN